MAWKIPYTLAVRLERVEGPPAPVPEIMQVLSEELDGFELFVQMEDSDSQYRLTVETVTTAIDQGRNV
ncbi:hypothetical protein EF910_05270 [Streptomyces sp. WAC07149]|uniref:hypothetical protein n=1 Tax=Streptomyces sp. WAC07149 TaxID=2487425 RepID=UPI000F7B41B4|nr:hypothetical protein [Streptomyces sp. WAC07149]RST07850.1 hypothetical protein EF910_05270 [Streptomyces sp. WAC07149]